ncbi:RNA polymerase sigma factor (sigma-70 family) [Rhodococcus percolatus]|uniref:sigma-70 family RNA polymerase sigma factor n=1 Tax=Rhodococcus opacus TaxID=37919 RepID=UPI00178E3239|nr:RNA polymerase sigma factor (sigma-70 family) [Rhodococcus opacus]MBP2207284.1 RNA polymerase sigma factor (sigma-70 family) [Rhodococcus opacus]
MDDETVLRAAYDEHGRELFALAYRSLGDRGRAEEAVQETFLRAWRRADRFDPRRATLRTWLYAICRNVVIDAIRGCWSICRPLQPLCSMSAEARAINRSRWPKPVTT